MQILFISIDVSQSLPNVLNYFGVSEDDAPTARIINMETGKKFNIATKKYTVESMSQLCQEVVDGTAQVNYTRARKHARTSFLDTFFVLMNTYKNGCSLCEGLLEV